MNKPKDAKKPQESKFSKAKPLIVIGGIVIATVSFIALGVVKAVDNLNNEAKVEGSRTQGQANVKVKKVVEDSVDGTIKVPDASPIAQQTREREERERQEARARGESHITQTRVVGEDSQNEYSGKPKSQEVDSLGQEVDESIEQNKRTTALNSDTQSKEKRRRSGVATQ